MPRQVRIKIVDTPIPVLETARSIRARWCLAAHQTKVDPAGHQVTRLRFEHRSGSIFPLAPFRALATRQHQVARAHCSVMHGQARVTLFWEERHAQADAKAATAGD